MTIDWEGSYAGVPFGRSVGLKVQNLAGWVEVDDIRTGDQSRPQRHGLYPGTDLLGGRLVTFSLVVPGNGSAATTYTTMAALEAVTAVQDAEYPLIFQAPGRGAEQIMARPRGRSHVIDVNSSVGLVDYLTLRFEATDPRVYSTTLSTLSTGPSTLAGGLLWPALWPASWGTAGSGGTIAATNSGAFEAPYVITFTGPATAPALTHTGQGKTLTINHALAAGETLVLDSQTRTLLLNGTASRYAWLGAFSQWFTLASGSNPLQFVDANSSALVSIAYRSARV